MESITLNEEELNKIIFDAWDCGNYGGAPQAAKAVIKTLKYERSRKEALARVLKELDANGIEHSDPRLVMIPKTRGASGYEIAVCCEAEHAETISNLEKKFNIVFGGKFLAENKLFEKIYIKGDLS